MLTLRAKAPSISIIQTNCLTAMGMQYTIATSEYLDVVTANGEQLTCTCGKPASIHIQSVQAQQLYDAIMNACRDAYTALFDLAYAE